MGDQGGQNEHNGQGAVSRKEFSTLEGRVKAAEGEIEKSGKEFQDFKKKAEAGWGKADIVALTFASTLLAFDIKIASFEFNLMRYILDKRREKRDDEAGLTPEKLKLKLDEHQGKITEFATKISALEGKATDFSGEHDRARARLTGLERKVDGLEAARARVAGVPGGRTANFGSTITDTSGHLNELNERINALVAALS